MNITENESSPGKKVTIKNGDVYEESRGRADIIDCDGNVVKDGEGSVKYWVLIPRHEPKKPPSGSNN